MFNVSPDIIILGFIAGFVLFKLYSILGQKDDDGSVSADLKKDNIFANVVDISAITKISAEAEKNNEEEDNLATGFEDVVAKIKAIEPNFSLQKFLDGAKIAFEMVLTSFAKNERATLKNLLNTATYNQFIDEIEKRIKNEVTLEMTLVSLPKIELKNVTLKGKTVIIDVLFESQQINILKNKDGEVLEGASSDIDNMEDIWTFSKELNSKQNWLLVNVNAA